jgi:hypothetical protein
MVELCSWWGCLLLKKHYLLRPLKFRSETDSAEARSSNLLLLPLNSTSPGHACAFPCHQSERKCLLETNHLMKLALLLECGHILPLQKSVFGERRLEKFISRCTSWNLSRIDYDVISSNIMLEIAKESNGIHVGQVLPLMLIVVVVEPVISSKLLYEIHCIIRL